MGKIREPVTFDTMVDDLAAYSMRRGNQKYCTGRMRGMGIVLRFASRVPDGVSALVAMAPANFGIAPERRPPPKLGAAAMAARPSAA